MSDGRAEPPDILDRTFQLGRRTDALGRHLRRHKLIPGHRISQIERAGSAVGALIEEAQGGESTADFLHKMSLAHKEARETFYWLRQLMASEVLPRRRLENLTDEARQIKLILAAITNSTKQNMTDPEQENDSADPEDEGNEDDEK